MERNPKPPAYEPTIQFPGARPLGTQTGKITCPSCRSEVWTSVQKKQSGFSHMLALMLCPFLCCCIPWLLDDCKNFDHYCPNCQAYLGQYRSL